MKTNHIWRCSRRTWTWLSGDPLHRALQSLLWCRQALNRGRCGVWTALRACPHERRRPLCTERRWATPSSWFRLNTSALQKNFSLKQRDRKRRFLNFSVHFCYHEQLVVLWPSEIKQLWFSELKTFLSPKKANEAAKMSHSENEITFLTSEALTRDTHIYIINDDCSVSQWSYIEKTG